MGHDLRKPVFEVSDQLKLNPACSATETSYNLESLQVATRDITVKAVLSGPSKKDQKYVIKSNNCLMKAKSIAECSRALMGESSKFSKF